ncbi:DUF1553 domain-containing protein [Parasediminibacterium sp. JCM 36343]|uniref:DUF1553 domain-containing protein n=1 Tax=Parasediminibacterium sp. JCM 36343 TaxID=3374279 RepID=UPI00397C5B21
MGIVKRFYFFILGSLFFIGCDKIDLPKDVEQAMVDVPEKVDYNIDVKPILSDKCFSCHGPDAKKQKADLRLDIADFAYTKVTESGLKAIKPGSLSKSEIIHRILSEDADYQMPTKESHLQLTPQEKAILIKWVKEGAKYKPHWAFVAPEKPDVPSVQNKGWARNDIDKFVLKRLEKEGLQPSAEADKYTLIRRVAFDITGLPPTLAEINHFVNDTRPNAYELMVDGYLKSPHYGERMAAYWLDVARFADSYGYLDDRHRDASPWRDWVINAYNKNLPFDKFITWQLAGDLLHNATQEQILATGFNRNHRLNSEAGIIDEEFRVEYVVDKTNTLGQALLATSIGCAKCHDHKYDPISQKDYYSLTAFFNSTNESANPNIGDDNILPGPTLLLTKKEDDQRIKYLKGYIQQLEASSTNKPLLANTNIENGLKEKCVAALNFESIKPGTAFKDAYDLKSPLGPYSSKVFTNTANPSLSAEAISTESGTGISGKSLKLKDNDETYVHLPAYKVGYFERYEPFAMSFWLKLPKNYDAATVFYCSDSRRYGYQGYDLILKNNHLDFRLSHAFPHDAISVLSKDSLQPNTWYHVAISYDGSSKAAGVNLFLDGKKIQTTTEIDHLVKNIRSQVHIQKQPYPYQGFTIGARAQDKTLPGGEIDELLIFNNQIEPAEAAFLYNSKKILSGNMHAKQNENSPLLIARKQLASLYDSIQEAMVMGDLPTPRQAYVLKRGLYDSHGDKVQPSTPNAILPYPKDFPQNRLGLANWLFLPQHPLTGRVAVNRIWELIFGRGLVKTTDDFGNQGEMPTHPELLDYLAVTYRENGWDTKAIQKMILMSATYRQSSVITKELLAKDPQNKLLARSSRYRMPAEMIRDNALAVSGLLVDKIGGKSVYPYQPEGLWDALNDKRWHYIYLQQDGEGLYRRSIYTVVKRSSVRPSMQIFDAPDRNFCTVKRTISSSPLQALVLLNDPQFVEAARLLAIKSMKDAGVENEKRFSYIFLMLTGRQPTRKELDVLQNVYAAELGHYSKEPAKASQFLNVGYRKFTINQPSELAATAALSTLALDIMNTDEFLTRK